MKVAVSACGNDLSSRVDPRFGRAKYFLIVDAESNAVEAVDNAQNLNAVQGVGIQAAETVSRHGAQAVLTGHCGPKAFRALTAAGIKVCIGVEGTVREAVDRFKAGKIKEANKADVTGHWW